MNNSTLNEILKPSNKNKYHVFEASNGGTHLEECQLGKRENKSGDIDTFQHFMETWIEADPDYERPAFSAMGAMIMPAKTAETAGTPDSILKNKEE